MFNQLMQHKEHSNHKQTPAKRKDIAEKTQACFYPDVSADLRPLAYIHSKPIQHHTGTQPVVQRKASVGVTLTVPKMTFAVDEVFVDTLTFNDRFDTGLYKPKAPKSNSTSSSSSAAGFLTTSSTPTSSSVISTASPFSAAANPTSFSSVSTASLFSSSAANPTSSSSVSGRKGSPTQGDHTIADVFIKKYQKDYLKNKRLGRALFFYWNLANELSKEELPPSTSGFMKNRYDKSKELSSKTLQKIDYTIHLQPQPLTVWNILFKDIATSYNEAYAKSLFSSQVRKYTGQGHGEAKGIRALKAYKHPTSKYKPNPQSLNNLIDIYAVCNVPDTDINYNSIAGISWEEAAGAIDFVRKNAPDVIFGKRTEIIIKNMINKQATQPPTNSREMLVVRFDVMKAMAIKSRREEDLTTRYYTKKALDVNFTRHIKKSQQPTPATSMPYHGFSFGYQGFH